MSNGNGHSVSDKRSTAQKEAAKKRPQTWKPGKSANPKGAPKRGESWTELIKSIGEMTGEQVAAFAGEMGKEFAKLPEGVTLKTLVIMRVYGQMINEPSPGLLNAFMDRVEGSPRQTLQLEGNDEKPLRVFDYPSAVASIARRPTGDHSASSQDQGRGDGPQVGQDLYGGRAESDLS